MRGWRICWRRSSWGTFKSRDSGFGIRDSGFGSPFSCEAAVAEGEGRPFLNVGYGQRHLGTDD